MVWHSSQVGLAIKGNQRWPSKGSSQSSSSGELAYGLLKLLVFRLGVRGGGDGGGELGCDLTTCLVERALMRGGEHRSIRGARDRSLALLKRLLCCPSHLVLHRSFVSSVSLLECQPHSFIHRRALLIFP